MSSQRYERVRQAKRPPDRLSQIGQRDTCLDAQDTEDMARQVADNDQDDHATNTLARPIPDSPPPSFRSRASSRRPSRDGTHRSEEEAQDLNDAFGAPSDDEDDDDDSRDRRRLISSDRNQPESPRDDATPVAAESQRPNIQQRRVTEIPVFTPPTGGRIMGGGSGTNDGVFANISAKPRPGEDLEEKPPTYEQAAADATPPYWETTVMSPYHMTGNPDDVFVDGLLVGSLFSFIWNALISMSFQLIGFLLTYLLHTTHAAKHGSRAGLGITLVQFGFSMRYGSSKNSNMTPGGDGGADVGVPEDPNSHDFDPGQVGSPDGASGQMGLSTSDWLSYVLMIVGWFILIRAVSDFMRARRQEQLIRSSPDRGLGVAVVAEGESPESSV